MKANKRALAMVAFREGKKPRDVAESLDVSNSTAYQWHSEWKAAKDDIAVELARELPGVVLHEAIEEISEHAPQELKQAAGRLERSMQGLDQLNEELQAQAFKILGQVSKRIDEDLELKELRIATEIVTSLVNAFNSKNITNVNVLNQTNINDEKLSLFKSSLTA